MMKHLCLLSFFVSLCLVAQAAERPNVIVILSDDQGWGDLSLNGNENLQTPNIDKLAAEGASFERFYVCPVCSPTRAEFLTGRYHPRGGVYSTSAGGERLNLDEMTIGDTFQRAGYHTAAFGKWHNGMQYPYHPNGRGFGEYYGFCSGHWGDYFSPMLEHNGQLTTGDGFMIDDFTKHAMQFMEQHKAEPFFIYLPFNTPHAPMQVPDRWWDQFKDKELTMLNRDQDKEDINFTRAALAMCENIDWNVGRLIDKLEELQLTNDTIILYFCDNGPNGVRWNGGMKGRKGSTDEGGVRSPLVIRWPKKIAANHTVKEISGAIDLLPTLADLCEIQIASKKPLDGISLKPLLLGESTGVTDRLIVSHWNKKVSVRSQQFRLDHQGKLYDMVADPGQSKDVSKAHPEMTEKLSSAATDYKNNVLAGYDDDQRPFLIGAEDYNYTQIPARDGTAHGNIERSNKFPNCSFFKNWISVEDKITWVAEVGATGDYDVELYYTCPAQDVGSTIELSFHHSKLSYKITEAHDPPLMGAEHDRVPRPESYVKDFKAVPMGRIHLEQGTGTLTLQATHMPGSQVMDFRLLMLTKVKPAK